MTILYVKVTAEDIATGRKNCLSCPVALAIVRTAPYLRAWVRGLTIEIEGFRPSEGFRHEFSVSPKTVRQFVKRFDSGRPVEPFAFSLELPDRLAATIEEESS